MVSPRKISSDSSRRGLAAGRVTSATVAAVLVLVLGVEVAMDYLPRAVGNGPDECEVLTLVPNALAELASVIFLLPGLKVKNQACMYPTNSRESLPEAQSTKRAVGVACKRKPQFADVQCCLFAPAKFKLHFQLRSYRLFCFRNKHTAEV